MRAVGELPRVPPHVRDRIVAGVPAKVPGCVHEDLIRAGVIGDPRVGMNEELCAWVGWVDWRYEAEFEVSDAGQGPSDPALLRCNEIDLVFDSLDTIAAIELNGVPIGSAQNEFTPHRFSVRGLVNPGRNTLAITFSSPLRYIAAESARLGPRPVNGDWSPYNMIRKCASSFEWDWGPRVAGCGITGEVMLEGSPRHAIHLDAAKHAMGAVDCPATFPPEFMNAGHARPHFDGAGVFCLGANWIPEGLFPSDRTPETVRARLQAARDCGMNMIRVWGGGRYEPDWFYDICDELGLMVWQDFMFACACYPEEEPIRSQVEAESRYQVSRLSRHPSVVLWCGGNENHWAYQSWGNGGFKTKLAPGQTWGHGYWHALLPRIIAEVDPSRPYWHDSPWSGDESIHPNDTDKGDRHSWDVNYWDTWSGEYQKVIPRFCSEFGQQSPSNYATLKEAGLAPLPEGGDRRGLRSTNPGVPPHAIAPSTEGSAAGSSTGSLAAALPNPSLVEGLSDSWSAGLMGSMLAHRQRGPGGNKRWYDDPIDAVFRRPRDFDEWHFAAQVIQARAIRTGVEWHRVNRPRCMGTLIWQLNDAWPGLSWSLIDSAGRKKPAWYAARAAMRPRILSVHLVDGSPALFAVNDTDADWRTQGIAWIADADAVRRDERAIQIDVPARSASRIGTLEAIADWRTQHAVLEAPGVETVRWFGIPDREVPHARAAFDAIVSGVDGGIAVEITTQRLMRDIVVLGDRIDPDSECDEQVFTLSPGEHRIVRIRTSESIEKWRDCIAGLIRCTSDIGSPA